MFARTGTRIASWLPRVWRALIAIIVLVVGLVVAVQLVWLIPTVFAHYVRGQDWPDWTGFGEYRGPALQSDQEFERGKTLWDLLDLLIVPIVLAGGALWFNRQEGKTERQIAEERLREQALQAYFDQMTELLLGRGLRTSEEGAEVRQIARARTLTVLRGLDARRKGLLLRFLHESKLITKDNAVIDLFDADLSRAELKGAHLSGAHLHGANLTKANLSRALLTGVDLLDANLSGATMEGAYLSGATLERANLDGATLTGVYLNAASLSEARVSGDQLAKGYMLWIATMPDGSRYDGRFKLQGDLEAAAGAGVETEDPEAMARWYAAEWF